MIETPEQYERAEEAVSKLKEFLLAAGVPIRLMPTGLYRRQFCANSKSASENILVYLSHSPDMLAGSREPRIQFDSISSHPTSLEQLLLYIPAAAINQEA